MQIKINPAHAASGFKIKNWLLLFCMLHAACCMDEAFGQGSSNLNSPYSRYGIGDLQLSGVSRDLGMGGLGIGVSSPFNLNISNPASYSALSLTTFEGGLSGNATSLKSSDVNASSSSVAFSYFAFGFPVKSGKWGFALGLLPYSNVGYNITDNEPDPDLGSIAYTYQGHGGVNQFFIGTGYTLFKNFRLGVNASYLFGTLNEVRTVAVPDNVNYFNTRVTDETTVGDFHFTFGMQFTLDSLKISHSDSIVKIRHTIVKINQQIEVLKDSLSSYQKRLSAKAPSDELKAAITSAKDSIALLNKQIDTQKELKKNVWSKRARRDWSFNLGATLSLATDISASKTALTELYIIDPSGILVVKDTAQNAVAQSGVIKLPLNVGVGFTMKKGTQWLFGVDVTAENWSTYSSFGASDSLVNSVRFATGAQYTPDARSISSYSKVIQYRLGFHYDKTYLQLKNTDLNEYGVSIGLGLPLRKALSVIQFAFEYGKMGTLVNQLVEVNYFRFTLGLTLNDIWFLKPRID